MKCKLAASVIVAVLIIGMLIPLADFDADTLTEDKYDISIPGTNAPEESIDFTLGNGNERSWNIYVVNKSTSYLDVSFNVDISDDDVTLTSKPSNTLLCPSTVTDHSNITAGVLTISVDKLSNVHDDVVVDFSIALTDISDKTSTTVEHIIFNVKVESIYDTTGTYNKFLGVFANDLPEPFDSPLIPFIVTIIFWMIVAFPCTTSS